MGNISDKLNYLAETKSDLRKALEEMGAEVTDETKFREYAEKFKNATPDTDYMTKLINGESVVMTDLIGEYKLHADPAWTLICPRIKITNNTNVEKEFVIPFHYRGKASPYNGCVTVPSGYIDFSRISVDEKTYTSIVMSSVRVGTLILPDNVNLEKDSYYNYGSNPDTTSFCRGLIFGQRVYASTSTWMYKTLYGNKRVVKFPKDFKVRKNTILYLNRIFIEQASLQEMIKNLYNYTDGTNRFINLGSTNKALLTTEEIQLALDKGWTIT